MKLYVKCLSDQTGYYNNFVYNDISLLMLSVCSIDECYTVAQFDILELSSDF